MNPAPMSPPPPPPGTGPAICPPAMSGPSIGMPTPAVPNNNMPPNTFQQNNNSAAPSSSQMPPLQPIPDTENTNSSMTTPRFPDAQNRTTSTGPMIGPATLMPAIFNTT